MLIFHDFHVFQIDSVEGKQRDRERARILSEGYGNYLTVFFRLSIFEASLPSVRFPLMLSRGYQRGKPLEHYRMLRLTMFFL